MYTLEDAIRYHRPALELARLIPRAWMHRLRILFATIAMIAGLACVALTAVGGNPLMPIALGITLIATGLWIKQLLIFSFHNYYFYFGIGSIVGIDKEPVKGSTYEVAEALTYVSSDIVRGFANSKLGRSVLLRSGLPTEAIEAYLANPRTALTTAQVPVDGTHVVTLITVGIFILQNDTAFGKLLASSGVQAEHFLGALKWVILSHHSSKRTERWWSIDMLSQAQGIARSWTYGHTYNVERYTKSIYASAVFANLTRNYDFADRYVGQLEETLARSQSANALLIGAAGVGKMDIVIALADKIKRGEALASVIDQTFVVLDTDALFAAHPDKASFEAAFMQLLNECIGAGNITLVIEHLGNFIREAAAENVFVPEIIDPYLAHPSFHVIALDTPDSFHSTLAHSGSLVRRFEEILIEEPGEESTVFLLQSIAPHHERNGIFTYPALEAIAVGADRYLVDGVMPDKAVGLLTDMAMHIAANGLYSASDVYTLIADKTGMPVGPVTAAERDTLLNLETTLHARVIGQDAALTAIARTMRRARAGIVNSERPLGSFLFLGPTGVGKTETAKALAYVFFGAEDNMTRLDMSEYSAPDRVGHLIGNTEETGVLPSLLQEHPYAVLLLDEFEKADRAIHDIFLQILDEGMFTSGTGERVNARNTIIIATSNAGSRLIIDALQAGRDLALETRAIVDHIINEGMFRPELINRFDNTIIFEPLSQTQQHSVAGLMLKGLQERIEDQGYRLAVTPNLLQALVAKGYDPIFGARPMQRVIQDVVEEAVAQKIIAGTVNKGDLITLDVTDVVL